MGNKRGTFVGSKGDLSSPLMFASEAPVDAPALPEIGALADPTAAQEREDEKFGVGAHTYFDFRDYGLD